MQNVLKIHNLESMSENDLPLLFTFFPSVDDSYHSEFHETTRGEAGRVTVKLGLHKISLCHVFKLMGISSPGHGFVQDD